MDKLLKDFKEKTGRNIPKKYVENLTLPDAKKQLKSIEKMIDRPELKSARIQRSSFTEKANKYFDGKTSKREIAKKLSRGDARREKELFDGLDAIYKKGEGAYYSSGSRPGVNVFQWAYARVFSVLFGGKSRTIDKEEVKKYNIPLLKM